MSPSDPDSAQTPATPVPDTAVRSSAAALIADADAALAELLHEADARPDHAVADDFSGTRVADIFAHLVGWHELFLGWLAADARKTTPAFPASGYEWDQLAELNAALVDRRKHDDYATLRAALTESHSQVTAAVRAQNEELLFNPDAHAWLGDESLGAVAFECLGNHYRWGVLMLGECAAP
ncbi:ClbS/DfsB family four-helix bundle protein [Demequina flava]|uniref:ClbS/DfsB family four-helix bundle protein n=1 Tax=Demequina flava TaxID=1095025 RepID=UPI000782F10A|nr:ClbS/DfsB family four-helix bundle protein [Demequina flava]